MLFADLKAWTEDRTQDLHITSVMHYHCAIQANNIDKPWYAPTGNRTRATRLEGEYPNHWTIGAQRLT